MRIDVIMNKKSKGRKFILNLFKYWKSKREKTDFPIFLREGARNKNT